MDSNNFEEPTFISVDKELEIFQKIVSEFKIIPEISRVKILKMIITFFNINLSEKGKNYTSININESASINSPLFSEDRAQTAKEFILEKQPNTDVERVACLAYYLTHYRDTPHFKTLEISKLNTEAAQRKFTNAAKAVDNATNYGYLVQATKGQKQLSADAELFVQALPDREAAKEIMKKARPRKKTWSKKTKKNNEK